MNNMRLTLLSIAAALALAGCGNKGPLVLPDKPDEAQAPVAGAPGSAVDATAPTEDARPATEAVGEDAPVEPEPLPQDDGDSD